MSNDDRNPYLIPSRLTANFDKERTVSWLELFYDLVYVATVVQLGNYLSHDVSWAGFAGFLALFVPIWWSWSGLTFFASHFDADDTWHRILIFTQIAAIAVMALSVASAIGELASQFALAYVVVRFVLVLLYARIWQHIPQARSLARRYMVGYSFASTIWLMSVIVPNPWRYAVWALGMAVDFWVPLAPSSRRLQVTLPPDEPHMVERYGLFTIIVLGESFIKVISGSSGRALTPNVAIHGIFALILSFSLWWLYFDDVAGSKIRPGRWARAIWIYSHLPVTAGIVAFGVGLTKLLPMPLTSPLSVHDSWLLGGAIIMYMVFVAFLDLVTVRKDGSATNEIRSYWRFGAAILIFTMVLASSQFAAVIYAGILAAICIGQVGVDVFLKAREQAGRAASVDAQGSESGNFL